MIAILLFLLSGVVGLYIIISCKPKYQDIFMITEFSLKGEKIAELKAPSSYSGTDDYYIRKTKKYFIFKKGKHFNKYKILNSDNNKYILSFNGVKYGLVCFNNASTIYEYKITNGQSIIRIYAFDL